MVEFSRFISEVAFYQRDWVTLQLYNKKPHYYAGLLIYFHDSYCCGFTLSMYLPPIAPNVLSSD